MKRNEKEAKNIIDKIEKRKGIKLTKEQKEIVERKVVKERKRRNIIGGLLLTLGFGVGVTTTNIVNNYNNSLNKTVNAHSDNKSFKDKIKVELKEEQEKEIIENTKKELELEQERKIIENTKREISNLATKKDVLDYIKEIYVEEYNKFSKNQITIEDIELRRDPYIIRLYKEVDNQGKENIRISIGDKKEKNILKKNESFEDGIISIINKKSGKKIQNIVNLKEDNNYSYYAVYKPDEKIKKYKNKIANRIGEIVDIGMELADSKEGQVEFKKFDINKLIEEVSKLKQEKVDDIVYGEIEKETTSYNEEVR